VRGHPPSRETGQYWRSQQDISASKNACCTQRAHYSGHSAEYSYDHEASSLARAKASLISLQGGQLDPIDLLVEERFHRAAPGGNGAVKAAGNYSPVSAASCMEMPCRNSSIHRHTAISLGIRQRGNGGVEAVGNQPPVDATAILHRCSSDAVFHFLNKDSSKTH